MPEGDDDMTCPVCYVDMRTGAHDLEQHRAKLQTVGGDWKANLDQAAALERSIANHPAGSRRPTNGNTQPPSGPVSHRAR